MQTVLLSLVFILGIVAYISAVWQMFAGQYKPSFFSRGVWFLLGINSFAGVFLGDGSKASVLLAAALLIGNTAVFAVSYAKGSRVFGAAEKISLGLLAVSGLLWAILDEPFLGLIISLVAHFIGGIPTIWRTIKKASSERAYHWYFFFVASVVGVIISPDRSLTAVLFPLYFALFDGLIIILSHRHRLGIHT